MNEIKSLKNSRVKELRKLYRKKYRQKKDRFILEGLRLIRGAYQAGADFENIFLGSQFYKSNKKESFLINNENKLIFVTEELIKEVADTENPQSVIAVVKQSKFKQDEVIAKDYILILDQIQDPGNMGTIIRTAVAAGFQSIIIAKGSVDIFNLKVLRASMGALFCLPIIKDIKTDELTRLLGEKDQTIYAADLETDSYYNDLKYKKPLSLIIGNEAHGIRRKFLDIADQRVKIQLRGNIESLNAGVAAGVLMFKILENSQ